MAPTKRGDRQHAPRTGPRVRRGTAPALLLAAAQELFAERGPYATTTRQIADRAEVSEDLIFRYYGSKNGLLQAAVVRPIVELLDSVRPRWEAAQDTWTGDDHERSVAFVGQLFDLVYGNRTVVMTMMQVLIGAPGEIDDPTVHELASQMYEPLAPAFTKYLERNNFRDTDPALLLRLIMTLIGASAAFLPGSYPEGASVPDRDRIVDELSTFIHYGIRRPD
jgi:AcrR family transcriptional regulator